MAHASRLPTDWAPGAVEVEYAKTHRLDPAAIAEAFRDYWSAASGANARKHDWTAAWRTWCRRAADQPQRSNGVAQTVAPAVALPGQAPVVGGVVPTWANGRDAATWAEARSLAKAIGFREPWPQESASAYQTQVKFEAQKAPATSVLERIGLRRGG